MYVHMYKNKKQNQPHPHNHIERCQQSRRNGKFQHISLSASLAKLGSVPEVLVRPHWYTFSLQSRFFSHLANLWAGLGL